MYKIMMKMPYRRSCPTTYKFLKEIKDGVAQDVEFEGLEQLDIYIATLLNNGYAKGDFIVIREVSYDVFPGNYSENYPVGDIEVAPVLIL